ncbi:MAG: serine/threonine-protein kinase [Kofleriaceae bacterium]
MARTPLLALGAALLAAGGAAAVWSVGQAKPGTNLESLKKVAAIIDGEVKQRRAEAATRAESTAIQRPLRAAIGTDAATLEDQEANNDFGLLAPAAGETLELGQTQGGRYARLLLRPRGGAPTKFPGQEGSKLELGASAMVSEIHRIDPLDDRMREAGYVGYLAVTRELSLAAAEAELARLRVPARLVHGDGALAVGAAPAASAQLTDLPIPSEEGLVLQVAAVAAVPRPVGPLAGGAAAAVVGLVLLVLGLGRRPGAARPGEPAARGTGGLAAGTPAPGQSPTILSGPAPGDSVAGLAPGLVIGRWEVIRRLGAGGMADVHLARSRGEAGFEKLVALKVMHPFLARNARAVEHFLDEARLAAQIVHANVAQIHDLGKIGEDYVIVMEYIDGANLDCLLTAARAAGRPVPIAVALGILRRICDGLTAAHRALASDGTPLHIVHRDVKSGNVLVSRQGAVKLVDFGIAKAAQQAHVTVAGETKGTPSMMAPEQRVGDVVDARADVYSTAAVGYELVTGAAVNLDLAALAHLGVAGWPHLPPPTSLRPQLPAELDDILLRAMAFEREARPPDCAALELLIEQVAKRHHLECSDKDIARWAQAELAALLPGEAPPAPASAAPGPSHDRW